MFNNKGAATTFAILAMSGLLGFGGYKGCSSTGGLTGPKFKVGECATASDREMWEKDLGPETFRVDDISYKINPPIGSREANEAELDKYREEPKAKTQLDKVYSKLETLIIKVI